MNTKIIVLLGINLVAMLLFYCDKRRAKAHRWRIREAWLLGMAIFGGGVGSLAGMLLFRHKTRHLRFRIIVPLCAVFQVLTLICHWKMI